jgi:hypothetical protein
MGDMTLPLILNRATRSLGLLLPLLLSSCAFSSGADLDLASEDVPEARGQMILFVGTNPATLSSELYLAQAVDSGNSNRAEGTGPDIIEADSFQLENLTAGLPTLMPSLTKDDLELFGDEAPFPIPDRTGSLIALLARGRIGGPSEGAGRIYLLDLEARQFEESQLIPGLRSVHFSWNGGFLAIEIEDSDDASLVTTAFIPTLDLQAEPIPALDDPEIDVRFAGLERSSNRLLLEVIGLSSAVSDVLLIDPETSEFNNLTEGLEANATDPILSPDGTHLALTLADPQTGNRSVLVFALDSSPDPTTAIGAGDSQECFWPVWQPTDGSEEVLPSLACVCVNSATERPDVLQWSPTEGSELIGLTAGPQPELFDGTMSGLTLRSRPQWDPSGSTIIFGASTQEQALDGEAMSLVALSLEQNSAYPVFSAEEGSLGWAHFSSALTKPHLLVWDRAETGLQDSSGGHAIQVVVVDEPGRSPHPLTLGSDLFVAYPQYLGANTMLYP